MVTVGKRDPHGRPSGPADAGPVVPWQPPRALAHTTHQRSVSMAFPGPMISSHHPALRCPGPAGPAAWLSPVRAWTTSTALSRAGVGVPHVSNATVTGPSSVTPPDS